MCQRLYLEVAVRLSVGGNLVPDMVFVFLEIDNGMERGAEFVIGIEQGVLGSRVVTTTPTSYGSTKRLTASLPPPTAPEGSIAFLLYLRH